MTEGVTPAVSSVHDGGRRARQRTGAGVAPAVPIRCRRARWARSRAARSRSGSPTSSGCPSRRRRRPARAPSSTWRSSTSCGGPPAERTIDAALADLARARAELAADPEFARARADRRGVGRVPRRRRGARPPLLRDRRPARRSRCSASSSASPRRPSDGVMIRGIIDRLELDADGELVVTDYKTGSAPSEGWEQKSMAGVHIYSLLCEQMFGRRPARVQLLYLSKPGADRHRATDQSLARCRGEVERGDAGGSRRRARAHDFRPRASALCDFCSFQEFCPEFGGDPSPRLPSCSRARPNVKAGRSSRSRSCEPAAPACARESCSHRPRSTRAVDAAVERVRSPALDRIVYPPVERGRSQPAVARVRRGAGDRTRRRSRRGRAVLGRDGCRVGADERSGEVAVRAAPAARPTPRSSSATACAGRSRRRSRPVTRPPRSAPRTLLGGGIGWYGLAAAVAATRVYVRLHHASDVVAGAAFGLALGLACGSGRVVARQAMMVGCNIGGCPTEEARGPSFAVSFDYRCPFARNGHESVVAGLRAGRTGTSRSCRSRSTRCTSKRASRPCGNGPRVSAAPACCALEYGHRGTRRVPRPLPRRAHRAVRRPPRPRREDRRRGRARARSMTSRRSRRGRGRGRGRVGSAARDARRGAHRRGEALGDVRRPDVLRRRSGRVRPADGTRHRRTTSTRSSTCSSGAPERVQAHVASRGSPRADVGRGSGDVGGREGPRAPLRLLQPHDPRSRARREAAAPHARPRARGDPPLAAAGRLAAAAHRSARVRRRPRPRPRLPRASHRGPCAARHARAARRVRATGREPARPVPPALGVHAPRRALGDDGVPAVGPRSCRRCTTRSATASAG